MRDCHYRIKKWPLHSQTTPGQKNVALPALGDKSKISLSLLHIKLDLTEISVKAVEKYSKGFACSRQKFPKISDTKMKEEIFVGPQVTQLFEDQYFSTELNSTEGRAWKAFENIFRNFLGKENAKNFVKLCRNKFHHTELLKLHFLHSLVDFFLKT